MPNTLIDNLRKCKKKFIKICNTLKTSDKENLPDALSKAFRKLSKRKIGIKGKRFLDLLEQIIFPNFWLKLGKNAFYKLKDYFYFVIFLSSLQLNPEEGSQMLKTVSISCPDADTLFYHLYKFSPEEIREITERINSIIFKHARRYLQHGFLKKSLPVAIDFTGQPFYGDESTEGVKGGKKKAGTTWFYQFASIIIIKENFRFTLAVRPVLPFNEAVDIVKWLINKAKEVIKIDYMEMDRGFFNKKVINYLIQQKYKFLMPGVKNNRIKEAILQFHEGQGEQCFKYKFKNSKSSEINEEFNIFMIKNDNKESKKQKKSRNTQNSLNLYHVFATNTLIRSPSNEKLKKIAEGYRKRWGIETGFRMAKRFQIKTSSVIFVARMFFYIFSVIFYNLWILFNLIYKNDDNNRYLLSSSQVKMLLLTKSLQFLILFIGEKGLKMSGGEYL